MRARRKVREGVVDRRQAFPAGHRLHVVEHDEQLPAERGDVVEELVDRRLDRAARHAEPPQRTPPDPRPHPIDRRRDVPPQQHRIVVTGVQHDPRRRHVEARAPAAHRGRLTVAGGSCDQRQRRVAAGVQRRANPRPIDHAVPDARHRELGLNQRGRRVRTQLVPGARCHRCLPSQQEPLAATHAARSGRRGVAAVAGQAARMPHAQVSDSPGARVHRPSSLWEASGAQVTGSTASERRRRSGCANASRRRRARARRGRGRRTRCRAASRRSGAASRSRRLSRPLPSARRSGSRARR